MLQLQFSMSSFLWLLLSLLLGLAYAFILYRGERSFSKESRRWLFILRATSVALICFLLFAPFVKYSKRVVEKPLIIFAQDNSASIALSRRGFDLNSYSKNVKALIAKLSSRYDVRAFTIGVGVKSSSSYTFDEKATNLSSLFRLLNDRYVNRNVGAVILASDGIYNQGGDPAYEARGLKAPVFTIAMGDSVPRKDLLVANINYNSFAYRGNDFRIEVGADAYQSKGTVSRLVVSEGTSKLFVQPLNITSDEFHTTIPVVLRAGKKGIHRFTVSLDPLNGEVSEKNNKQDFFVEVIEGKLRVFILGSSPHPDIGALKQGIESNASFEVKTGFAADVKGEDIRNADLVILHQIPSAAATMKDVLPLISGKPLWFIPGVATNISAFSAAQNLLEIRQSGNFQEVTAGINKDFHTFLTGDKLDRQAGDLGPLLVPSGAYRVKSPASILFYQQIGHTLTDRPLLILSNSPGLKIGILAGEGIWRWRLNDYRVNGSHDLTNQLIWKMVQFLSDKGDRRKFRVYPAKTSFDANEHILLNAELYNDANELVNTPDVSITLTGGGNQRKYSFMFSRTGNAYMLNGGTLPAGEYSFTARTSLGSRNYYAEGRFIVAEQQVEFRQSIADHRLLYTLSKQSGGRVVAPEQADSLFDLITGNELVKSISYEDRTFDEMISMKWIFFLIAGLVSLEWLLRKRQGDL